MGAPPHHQLNVKKLFHPKDRHPNKSGYKELADFIWRELLKRNELGAR